MSIEYEHRPLSSLQRHMRKDFRLSFLHSQGSETLQFSLYARLARHYKNTIGVTAFNALASGAEWLAFGTFPVTYHGDTESATVTSTMEASNFRNFMLSAYDPNNKESWNEFFSEYTGNDISELVIGRDLRYQSRTRRIGPDPHASYFRTHVLLGRPTGSDCYDDVYKSMRTRLTSVEQIASLGSLASSWEVNHPGERFGPDLNAT